MFDFSKFNAQEFTEYLISRKEKIALGYDEEEE